MHSDDTGNMEQVLSEILKNFEHQMQNYSKEFEVWISREIGEFFHHSGFIDHAD